MDGVLQHTYAEDIAGLGDFCGSKYVQSFIGESYREAENFLKAGREVFFAGTPCQIAGLKMFLGEKNYPNLFTADLICHGVPPMKYLREHLRPGFSDFDSLQVQFRSQDDGYCIRAANGRQTYSRAHWTLDPYCNGFMQGVICRDSCFQCPFAQTKRTGDLTLGDFWGLDRKTLKTPDPARWISAVLVNTPQGEKLWERVSGDFIQESRPPEEAVRGNWNLHSPSRIPPDRAAFRSHYPQKGFKGAMAETQIPRNVRYCALKRMLKKILFPERIRKFLSGRK